MDDYKSCHSHDRHTRSGSAQTHNHLRHQATRPCPSRPFESIMKFILALSLLSGALALPTPHATASHKVSLSKGRSLTHSNGRANIPEIFASLDATLAKFQHIKPLPHYKPVEPHQAEQPARTRQGKSRRPVNVPLTDQYSSDALSTDIAYYGPVTIGSGDGSAQTFQLWVHRSI